MKLRAALQTAERIHKNTHVFLEQIRALNESRSSYAIFVRLADGTVHQVLEPEDWPPNQD